MREIKFRARNASLPRCWIYGYFVVEDGSNYIINDEGKFKVIAGTEGQYIGRKDKNDKEIYEGDIVKFLDGELYKVKYFEIEAGFMLLGNARLMFVKGYNNDIEITGNIYENPELLEGK